MFKREFEERAKGSIFGDDIFVSMVEQLNEYVYIELPRAWQDADEYKPARKILLDELVTILERVRPRAVNEFKRRLKM